MCNFDYRIEEDSVVTPSYFIHRRLGHGEREGVMDIDNVIHRRVGRSV